MRTRVPPREGCRRSSAAGTWLQAYIGSRRPCWCLGHGQRPWDRRRGWEAARSSTRDSGWARTGAASFPGSAERIRGARRASRRHRSRARAVPGRRLTVLRCRRWPSPKRTSCDSAMTVRGRRRTWSGRGRVRVALGRVRPGSAPAVEDGELGGERRAHGQRAVCEALHHRVRRPVAPPD